MRTIHPSVIAGLLLLITTTIHAQVICPTDFPAQSPVASYSPDDIPVTNVDIITYNGNLSKARANHGIAFVEFSPNDQRVWFGVDAAPSLNRIFYNRRVRDTSTSPWRWLYQRSPVVIQFQPPVSAGPASVLYSSTAKYLDVTTGTNYKFLMYLGLQPGACDGKVGGFIYLSFSNDGICWTPPRQATRAGGPWFPCNPYATDTVPVESGGAIDGGSTIYIVGIEGNFYELAPPLTELDADGFTPRRYNNMNRTLTGLATASPSNPGVLTLLSQPELSAAGVFSPNNGPNNMSNPTRYRTYAYMMNLQIAWDALNGDFFIGRAYPYPYDRGSAEAVGWYDPPAENNTPLSSQLEFIWRDGPQGSSPVQGCIDTPGTLPNRLQIYKMHIGSLSNFQQLATGTWTLVADIGGSAGYGYDTWLSTTPLIAGQTNVQRDFGAISFLRDRNGNLVRYGSTAYYFAADTYTLSKGQGPCQITGLERVIRRQVP